MASPTPSSAPADSGQLEQLLGESAWVRRVALAIAGDEAVADDLAQDAWLAALRRVRSGAPVHRGWLAGVVRNLGKMRQRGEARREGRERLAHDAGQREVAPAPIERLEQQQLVLRAVYELEEPYRTAVILRWLDGLEPAEIAMRSGIPVRTVHTRITRALQLLRERLGRHPDLAASIWARAWAAILGRSRAPGPLVLALGVKGKVAVVAGAVALLVGLWFLVRAGGAPSPSESGGGGSVLVSDAGSPAAESAGHSAPSEVDTRSAVQSAKLADAVAAADLGLVRGRILDADGAPLAGAIVYLRAVAQSAAGQRLGAPLAFRPAEAGWKDAARTSSDEEGRFQFAEFPTGHVQLAVRSSGYAPFEHRGLGIASRGTDVGDVQLARGVQLIGQVADSRGQPVASANLQVRGEDDSTSRDSPPTWLPAGRTGAAGDFAIDGVAPGPWELRVESDDHPKALASGQCDAGTCSGIEIRLDDGYSITGRVEGAASGSEPLVVRARYRPPKGTPNRGTDPKPRDAPVASDGTFTVRGLWGSDSRWNLGVWRANDSEGNPPPLARQVEGGAGDRDVVLSIPAVTRLVLRPVNAESRAPVLDARCEVGLPSGYLGTLEPANSASGSLTLELAIPEDTPYLRVVLKAPGFERAVLRADAPPIGEVFDLGDVPMKPAPVARVRVLDRETGEPIAGARVVVENLSADMGWYGGANALSREPKSIPVRDAKATTDAAGEALIDLAHGSPAAIVATAEGYAPGEVRLDAPTASEERAVELTLERGASLDVLVQSRSNPVVAAIVRQIRHDAEGESELLDRTIGETSLPTDGDGIARFRNLKPGRYRFGVRIGGASWYDRGRADVVVAEGAQQFVLELPPRTELSATLLRGGRPLVGATVRGVVSIAPTGVGMGDFVTDAGQARSDLNGRLRLEDLSPGKCELLIEHPSLIPAARWAPTLAPGRNELTFAVANCSLRGKAVDPAGAPVGSVVLVLSVPSGKPGFLGNAPPIVVRTTTEGDGTFGFEGLSAGVPLNLAIEGGLYLPHPEPIVLAENEVREGWVLQLGHAGRLHVVIDAPSDQRVAGRIVAEKDGDRRAQNLLQGRELALESLPPGTWSVCFEQMLGTNVLSGPVDAVVEGGKTTEVRLQLP